MNNMKSRGSGKPQKRRPSIKKSSENISNVASSAGATDDDNACVVCFKNVEIYSIGDCDHPVCYECSTRMRVLCQQNECPICRHVLSKVLFTLEKLPYRQLEASNRSDFYSKRYRIGFCSAAIQQKFFQLLNHPCSECDVPPYRTFEALRNHVEKEHSLFFCDLCVETLKIFTFERRCYTKAELKQHNNKGDLDNRSHRGHPLCEFCKQRYVDRDELFRHLRREHYFCHFCDADGCNEFYNVYADLDVHFREKHYLCEECATEKFVGVFRNDIEYKAHVASVHGKSLNKQQAKQTRTLQLEITLGPRGRSGQSEQEITNMRSRNNEHNDYFEELPSTSMQTIQPVAIDAGNEQEFPTLGGAALGPNVSLVRPPPPSMRNLSGTSGLARTKENFPALGGAGAISSNRTAGTFSQPGNSTISSVLKKPPSSASTNTAARANASAKNMLLHVSNRPASSDAKNSGKLDFPALPVGKSKKFARNLEEDMLPSNSGVPMTNVSAKHRTLVDDYVSVANPSNYQKLQLVQKEEQEAKARLEALKKSAPKLTSVDFPSLAPSTNKPPLVKQNNSPVASNWVKSMSEKKQRELDNRKSKVAPAPVLPISKTINSKSKANNNNQDQQQQDNKKDKKTKEKQIQQDNQSKTKQKEKNNNEQSPSITDVKNPSANPPTIRVPPGFNADSPLKPPPGFMSNVTVKSVAKLPNNLTFTSSLGENYDIVPSTHSYTDPPNATERNQKLVDQFKDILKTPEVLNEFRLLSQKFRDGSCYAQAYYEHCQQTMHDTFYKLFPELLVMLPDIAKQQELYLVYKQHYNTLTPTQRQELPNLNVCDTCKQVILESDSVNHQKVHELTKEFPSLRNGSSTSNGAAGAVNKKTQRK